ncbi:DUF4190 domain-containing protein [Nocardia jejuensis]|uniref:DUF4190 domain-containing protein n=1 Tax=Nocardia jejuensis TaxID=328049 RepID=UPI00082F2010|nr:DUF4190 domain-containing protein [Nocardia jejuensis]
MTNSGGSDEWWKQYGGEGVSPDATPSTPQQPVPPPAGYSSAPNLDKSAMTPPPQSPYPSYPPPQANPSGGYPQQAPGGYQQSAPGGYPQQPSGGFGQPSGGFAQQPAGGYPQPGGGYQQPGAPAPGYGYPGYQPYGYQQPSTGTNGMAIASLIVSILGLTTLFFCFLPIGSLVGLVLGVIANNQVKTSGQEGRGLAQGGIWVGAAGLALGVLMWIFIGAAFLGSSDF